MLSAERQWLAEEELRAVLRFLEKGRHQICMIQVQMPLRRDGQQDTDLVEVRGDDRKLLGIVVQAGSQCVSWKRNSPSRRNYMCM